MGHGGADRVPNAAPSVLSGTVLRLRCGRFIVQFNDGEHMNVPADRMELKENFLFAWRGTELIAMVDISAVICAHMSEKG